MTTKDPATRGALSRDASMLAPRRPKITGAPKEAQPARSTQSASATLPASAGIRESTPSRSVSPITITCHRVATQMRALRQRGESHLASVTARQPPPAMSTRWLARRRTVAPPTKRPCRSAPSLAVRHTERQAAAPSQPAPAPQSSSSPPKPTVCHAGLPPPEKTPPKTTP